MATDTTRTPALLSDDARDGTPERPDELGRQTFTDHLTGLLDNVRAQSESSVLALIGDWGSGKSTILELLTKTLDSSTWLVGTFNPWSYPDTAALQRGFFTELAATLPKDTRPGNARAKISALARTLSPLGALGSILGLNAEGTVRLAADLIAGDTSTTAAKHAPDHALRATGRPILMIIDDLDRLTPDELLEVLKLVRLVGRLPHVYYLLSYDEHTLLDVLQRTPIAGDDQDRAQAYLEKIVQVRLDMPALRDTQRSDLLNRGLQTILTTCGLQLDEREQQRLSHIYDTVLDHRLRTPRAINRFLGQVHAFYPSVHREVDFVDFFLLTWLRTEEPGIYTMLQQHRDDLLGRSLDLWLTSRRREQDATERRARWQARIDAAQVHPNNQPGVIRVLSELFPELQAALTTRTTFTVAIPRTTPRAISNSDYFDRYLNFGVPSDDLPDTVMQRALTDLANGTTSPDLDQLTTELRSHASRATRKIEVLGNTGSKLNRAIFELLTRTWPQVDTPRSGPFDDPRLAIERSAAKCLVNMDPEHAVQLTANATHDGNEIFVVNIVQYLHRRARDRNTGAVPEEYDLDPLRQVASDALLRLKSAENHATPFSFGALDHFWAWQLLDPDAAHAWLRKQVDDGDWNLADTLGAFTSVATTGIPARPETIGEFDMTSIDATFTLERIYRDLAHQFESLDHLPGAALNLDIEATPANRVRYALTVLDRERNRRAGGPLENLIPGARADD